MSFVTCPAIDSLKNCSISISYIRPDQGYATIPFLYALAFLFTTFFSVFTRVLLEWKSSQLLTLILASLSLGLITIAYVSTHLHAESIYIWTPLTLVNEIGALIHVMFCVMNDNNFWLLRRRTQYALVGENQKDDEGGIEKYNTPHLANRDGRAEGAENNLRNGNETNTAVAKVRKKGLRWKKALVVFAATCCIALMGLQFVGTILAFVHYYNQPNRPLPPLQQVYCSPGWAIGNTTFNSDGTQYPIFKQNGVGVTCVSVDGNQPDWLFWTAYITLAIVVTEIIESVVLFAPNWGPFRKIALWRDAHKTYNAPLATMVTGLLVWLTLVIIAYQQISYLPRGLDSGVLGVVSPEEGVCRLFTTPGGLRGTIIAWSDGVFGGLGIYQYKS